jgi:hypothetical protein
LACAATPVLLLLLLLLQGFDLALVDAVSKAVTIPIIASSGAGAPKHFTEVGCCISTIVVTWLVTRVTFHASLLSSATPNHRFTEVLFSSSAELLSWTCITATLLRV